MFELYLYDPEHTGTQEKASLKSEYIIFCMPGAHPAEETLPALQRAFEENPQLGMAELREQPQDPCWMFHPVTMDVWIPQSLCFAVRRTALEQAGGFRPQKGYCMHVDLMFRIRNAGFLVRYVPQAQYLFEENTILANTLQRWEIIYLTALFESPEKARGKARLLFGEKTDMKRVLRIAGEIQKENLYQNNERSVPAQLLCGEERRLHEKLPDAECGGISFSVLIRTYHRTETLQHTLESLLHQTYRNFEVVVAEDGDEPAAQALCEKLSEKLPLRYLCIGKHVRRSNAGNIAMQMAKGDYFVFLDEDDYFLPNHLELLARTLHANPECRIAVCASAELWGTNLPDGGFDIHRILRRQVGSITAESMCVTNRFPIQAAAFHRSLPEQYGGLDAQLDALEDWDLWVRYAMHTGIAAAERITSMYRMPDEPEKWEQRERAMSAGRSALLEKWKNIPVVTTAADIFNAGGIAQHQDGELEEHVLMKKRRMLAEELCASRCWKLTAFLRLPAVKIAQAAEWIARRLRQWSNRIGPENPDFCCTDEKIYADFAADVQNSWCWRISAVLRRSKNRK